MITLQSIKKLATKYQTTDINIAREYSQHLFLSYFYKKSGSERILFKGGTALRIIYKSPRFSKDLDFSGFDVDVKFIEDLIVDTLLDLEREGIRIEKIPVAKTTAEGYILIIKLFLLDFDAEIRIDVSLRNGEKAGRASELIVSDFIPSYTIFYLKEKFLVNEKIQALLRRGRSRDFFDLYFILRHSELVKFIPPIPDLKNRLLELVDQQDGLGKELKIFLPVSSHHLFPNFKDKLKREIKTHIG